MKNFLQVNRALAAEKNFTKLGSKLQANQSQMARNLHVIERRFSSTDRLSGSRSERSLTSEEASIQHPLSIHSASIQHPLGVGGNQVATRSLSRIWKYVAMMALLLTLACGNVWGANITVTPYAPTNITSIPYGLFTLSHSSTASSSKISSGAITTGTNGDVITIHFETTKSDIYIKSITFNSLSNGTLSSSDGTISSNTFTASSSKNAVDIVLTSGASVKGTVKITNVVIDPGTNDIETITFSSYSDPNVTFTSSAVTSALTSITKTSGSNPSVSSNILTWPNSAVLTFSSSRKITYIALQRNDGKNDSFTSSPTGMSDFAWSGNSNTVAFTNSAGGGRPFAKAYIIAAPACTSISPSLSYTSTSLMVGDDSSSPTLTGNTGSGTVTWTSSDEDVATVNESTGVVTAVAAGTATITASIAANGGYCNGSATANFTITRDPVGEDHELEWTVRVENSETTVTTTGKNSTSSYLTSMSNISIGGSLTVDNSGKNSGTGKIKPTSGDKVAANCLSMTFTVADGYTFTPSDLTLKTTAVSTKKTVEVEISDTHSHSKSATWTQSKSASTPDSHDYDLSGSSYEGTVTIKIWVYNDLTDEDVSANNGYRLGTPITLVGDVAAAAAGCANYSFHYGTTKGSEDQMMCFSQVGSSTTYITEEWTIPSSDQWTYVGWQGSWHNDNAKSANLQLSSMRYGKDHSNTLGSISTNVMEGAKGYVQIYSDNNESNKYVGFVPSGYILRRGTDSDGWTSTAFIPDDADDVMEDEWTTPLTSFTADNADHFTYVGLKTASGYVWTNRSETRRPIFLKPNATWKNDNAKFVMYYWDDSSHSGYSAIMTDPDGDGVYEAWIPNTYSYNHVLFGRLNPVQVDPVVNWDNKWNQTTNQDLPSDKNLFEITGGSDQAFTGSWSVYGSKGKFHIWSSSNTNNWYCQYYPHYVLTYDANDGSGEPSAQGVPVDGTSSERTVEVAAGSGMTAPTGYTFAGWNPDEDDADAGTIDGDYDPSDNVTLSADMTLYAVWSPKEYTITLDDESATTSVSPSSVTATYNSSTIVSITNPVKTGYTFGGWYSGDDGTGTLIIDTNGDLQANTAYTGAGGIWTNDDDVTLHALWTVNTYDVKHTFSNVSRTGGGTGGTNAATYGVDYSVTVGANSGYTLPAGISVTIGGDATTHYTWSSGTVTVDGNYILGDVVITISGVPTYTVTYSLNGGEYNGSSTAPTQAAVTSGTSITLPSLTPTKDGYVFASWKCSVGNTYHWESYSYTMTAANTTFTAQWVAAADMEDGTLYTVDDIKPLSVNAALSSTGQYAKGISSNGVFTSIGNPLRTDNSDGTFEFKTEDKQTVDEIDFTKHMWFKGASNVTSNVPTSRGLKFSVASAGTLSVYCTRGDRISLSDGTNSPVALTTNTSGNIIRRDVTISAAGTYYLLSTNSSNGIAGMKFVATPACSTPADPDGLAAGSISSSGVTFTITDDESPASYEIYYSTDDDAPEASTPATTTTTSKSKAVTGLTVGTTYYAWVRSVCDEDHKSSWVAASSFSTLHQYAISYDKGEYGTGSISGGTKTEGTAFTLSSEKFTRSGYVQTGWALIDGGPKAYELGGSYTTDAAQTFYPVWGAVYTVTFNTNGTGSVSPITQSTYGGSISMPSGPSSTDSTFLYWVIGGNTYAASASYTPTSNITAYAAWKEKCSGGSTEIRFLSSKNDSGNAFASMSTSSNTTDYAGDGVAKLIAIGSASLDNSDNDKRGFRSDGRLDVVFKLSATSTLTIYVNQNGSTNRSYQLEGFSSVKSLTDIGTSDYSSGTSIVTSNITVTGDNFTGTSQAGSGSASSGVITISGKGGLKIIYSSLAAGYYVFKSTGSSSSYIWGFDLSGGSGGTCYYVKYDGNGAESGSINDATAYTSSSNSVTVLGNTGGNAFVRDGYTFNGWNTKANGSGDSKTAGGTFTITKDTVLYAQWLDAATTYTVSITADPDGYGSVSSSSVTSVASGTTLSTSTNTLSVGATNVTATATSASAEYTYSFNNWTKSDGTALPSTVTEDLSVYANFTRSANSYTLTWNTNGGSDLDCDGCTSGSVAYGASVTAPNDPTLSNYTFDGWNTANDGSGTTAGATMPAANTTYYAAWKQTVTLTTGAQGSGSNQTPIVYLNGTSVSDFTPHTASGYSLQGYYTAGSGGVKVLNADGTFAAANVTDYITSSKWSRTGAAPTLYAQWVATEDCRTLKYVWKVTGNFCDDQSTATTDVSMISENDYFTLSGTGYKQESGKSLNLQNTQNNYFLLTAKTGYEIKSICFYGKVQDSSVDYTTDNSTWTELESTKTDGDDYYSFNNINASHFGIKLTAATPEGIWIRNMVIEVCAAGGTTYSVTYDGNDETGGTAPTDASSPYAYGAPVTVLGNTGSLEKTNYTFAGWTTNNNGTGSSYEAGSTFSITDNTTLYAKWTQGVTFDANTDNHGSTGGSATAVWNATGLTGITHATPVSGYKLLGYYTAATSGTKVINSDGTYAETDVTDYITEGKWSRTDATTLYAQYEVAGSLTWNLVVNSDTTSLTTSSKTSSFTEILNSNMTNAALAGSLTYEGAKKSALTGKISTPASYTAADYVYVTFQVADGYKFTPSMIQVPVQPVGNGEHKAVELRLTDTSIHSLVSGSPTKCDGTEKGKKTTVTLAGNGTYFTGTVTLKIYVYPHDEATATTNKCYRLGTPITIEGSVEASCATMPDYESMSYTTLEYTVGDDDASAISIVGGENIDTYTWKQNTTNDRTGGSAVSTGSGYATASFTPDITSAGTTYYWCEMTNTSCGLTIKSSAVAVTVSASKTNPTVTWDPKAKLNDSDTTAYYGGKDYTIKATLNSGWNGTLTADMMTAPAGIRLHDFTIDNSSNPKTIQATFDVQTGFDVDENDSIAFTLSLPETATYNALNSQKKVAYNVCSGGGSADEYLMPVDAAHIDNDTWKGAWVYEGTGMMCYGHGSSSISAGTKDANIKTLAHSMAGGSVTKYYKSSANHFGFYTEKAITGVRMYVYTSNTKSTVSGVYISNSASSSSTPSTGAISYEAAYYNDDDGLLAATNDGCTWVEITFASEVAAGKYGQINVSSNVYIAGIALISGSGAGASLTTTLGFASASVSKTQSDANFTNLATTSGENANTLGAITYSSSNTSCATVNATTGEVDITATGSSELSTTITATLAASGCFKGATATYTLTVAGQSCDINAGTLAITAGEATKCASDKVTLSLSGHTTDGTTATWYRGETNVTASVLENTLTTSEAGTYSVVVSDGGSCTVRSNAVTISNKSAEASVSKLVDEWYIKQGRLTPDVALFDVADATSWTVKKGKAATAIYTSDGTTTTTGLAGVGFKQVDNIVYLEGTAPTGIDAAANDTIIITVIDACGNSATSDSIVIHKQIATDKHVLAFVVTGTEKGGFTAGLTAEQTTELQLYKTLTKNFDVVATNIYSTDDEQKLKEYYSQFDILCITDYPNTKTKGVNSKSYVDAIGALIDIRPILTMEAWVSGLTNWKSKGISGTPKSPTTRQYSMLLQCKDHEIFSGTLLTKIGEGDETMYRVTMVDQTVEEYPTLDGYTPGSKDYNAGGKPALQGFEYTSAMSDLLPIGRIDDGAGNDLQVGIERQHEMEARLLVLGINSYAMERLKDDGEKVVVNALKYLMKKNAEDISDCSVYFDDASGDHKWNNPENWGPSYESLPLSTQEVRIYKPCIVDTVVRAASVKIIPNGKYSHGAATANGKLTIAPTGALIVGGKIYAATAPNFFEKRTTEPENLVVEANSTKTGTLIFDNEDGETQATIEMYSPSHWEIDPGTGKYVKYWSYVGMPIKDVHIPDYFYGAFTYYFNEAKGWEKRFDNDIMQPFEGIGLSMQSGHKETFYGTMVSTENTDITITNHTGYGDGDNLIGNSWTAPIQIANFDEDDFGTCWATVYIFNTGKGGDTYVNATIGNDGAAKAGQWLGVPIGVAGLPEYTGLKVIPAMNAFLVHDTVSTGTTLHLDYNKLVREGADTISQINQPMRAPKQARPKKKDVDGLLRIRVVGETTNTDVWMLQDERFSERYDNGWEAYFSGGDNRSPVLYAQSAVGPMGIVALQDLDGTVLGFAPSRDGNDYTFTFYYRGDDEYYLNDLKLQQSVLIDGENNYNFTFEKGDTNRFYVSRTPFEAPQITTDVDNTSSSANQSTKAIKVIYNDKLYIIRGGRVYSADGTLVK